MERVLTESQIVPKTSAVLPGSKNAESYGIQENHRDMVRYISAGSKPYKTVSGLLRECVQGIGSFVDQLWKKYDDAQGQQG